MIKPAIYLPGEVILKKGDFGDSLCFLQRGYIEVSETFLAERYNIYRLVINSIWLFQQVVDGAGQVTYHIQSGDSFGKVHNFIWQSITLLYVGQFIVQSDVYSYTEGWFAVRASNFVNQ